MNEHLNISFEVFDIVKFQDMLLHSLYRLNIDREYYIYELGIHC